MDEAVRCAGCGADGERVDLDRPGEHWSCSADGCGALWGWTPNAGPRPPWVGDRTNYYVTGETVRDLLAGPDP